MTRARLVVILCTVLLASCGTPPKERFYVLGTMDAAAGQVAAATYSIDVGPVTLPESVDRPQFVLRTGPNRVELSELNRWAEPLKKAIPRVVASHLAQGLGTRRVYAYPQHALPEADYRVAIDVLRFESAPEQQEVTIEALWSVRQGARGDLKSGHSLIREVSGTGDYDALVAAHERALARLSSDIAESLRAMEQARQESTSAGVKE